MWSGDDVLLTSGPDRSSTSADDPVDDAGYDPMDLVGTGRHLSEVELRAWTRVLDTSRLLQEQLARHLSEHHAMTLSDYEVLVRLDGDGGSMRMSKLASQVVSSLQKLTHTANRLEARGWIQRVAVPSDGRGLQAELLPPGHAALAAAADGHAALIRQFLLDGLSTEELTTLGDTMDGLATHLRVHRSGEPCPRCDEGEATAT